MAQEAPIAITLSGTYNPTTRSGTTTANFTNEQSIPITGRVQFVIIEDSIYYPAPNGDAWHNHVARDYLPDWNGEVVTIPGGETITLSRDFTLSTDWDPNYCQVIVFIQDDYLQPDSNKFVYQGAKKKINEFVAVEEISYSKLQHNVYPNPVSNFAIFSLPNLQNLPVEITIYNSEGKVINQLSATNSSSPIIWNLTNKYGRKVEPGIYFYHLRRKEKIIIGKLVVIE